VGSLTESAPKASLEKGEGGMVIRPPPPEPESEPPAAFSALSTVDEGTDDVEVRDGVGSGGGSCGVIVITALAWGAGRCGLSAP
jgi:hypothetical protein